MLEARLGRLQKHLRLSDSFSYAALLIHGVCIHEYLNESAYVLEIRLCPDTFRVKVGLYQVSETLPTLVRGS